MYFTTTHDNLIWNGTFSGLLVSYGTIVCSHVYHSDFQTSRWYLNVRMTSNFPSTSKKLTRLSPRWDGGFKARGSSPSGIWGAPWVSFGASKADRLEGGPGDGRSEKWIGAPGSDFTLRERWAHFENQRLRAWREVALDSWVAVQDSGVAVHTSCHMGLVRGSDDSIHETLWTADST